MIIDKVQKYLAEQEKTLDKSVLYEVGLLSQFSFQRQFMDNEESDNKGKLRLSSSGKCPRQLAYGFWGIERRGKELDARSKLTFFAGDLCEIAILQVAKLALKKYGGTLYATGRDQISIRFEIEGTEVTGHPDGLYLENRKTYLVEVKSMSSFGFKKFENGEIDEAYLAQINMYMDNLGLNECIVIGYDKNSNVLHEVIIKKDKDIINRCKETILAVIHSAPEKLPEPKFYIDEKGFYPWNCLYCSWWQICKPEAAKVLVGKSYKLKVSREKHISDEQQRSLAKGLQSFGVGAKVLQEYLDINFGI